jgi:predicted ArsR family transcriptional regulator
VTAPLFGPAQYDLILLWASRRKGTTAPEIAEHFGVEHRAAWRTLQRLVEQGRLYKLPRKRVRSMLFGFGRAGRGADIYKTRPIMEVTDGEDEAE